MNRLSKISIVLSVILLLGGCGRVGSTGSTIGTSQLQNTTEEITTGTEIITIMKPEVVIGISDIESKVLDLTPYIESKTKEDIYNNISSYIESVYLYSATSHFFSEGCDTKDAEYTILSVKAMNKRYPIDLKTNYPAVDSYYKMLDDEAKTRIETLSYVDGIPTFTESLYPNHQEIEEAYYQFKHEYYRSNLTEDKINSLGYPFDKVKVNNTVTKEVYDLEKECMENYEIHHNNVLCLEYGVNRLTYFIDSVIEDDKEAMAGICFEILCNMRNFVEEYQGVVGEKPEDVEAVNQYIEKYSSAYMYILQNYQNMTNEEVYNYLNEFLFLNEENQQLQDRIYAITIPNVEEILTIED